MTLFTELLLRVLLGNCREVSRHALEAAPIGEELIYQKGIVRLEGTREVASEGTKIVTIRPVELR